MRARRSVTTTKEALEKVNVATPGTGSSIRMVEFRTKAAEGSKVFLAGSFNNWDQKATPMTLDGGSLYTTSVPLPPGRHEYKFIVNGRWQIDEQCKQWVPNKFGSLNSVVEVA